MAKRRGVREEVLSPLLVQLATAKRLLEPSTANSQAPMLFDKIKSDLEDMRSFFRSKEENEVQIVHSFEAAARRVDDLLEAIKAFRLQAKPPAPPPPPPPPAASDQEVDRRVSPPDSEDQPAGPSLPSQPTAGEIATAEEMKAAGEVQKLEAELQLIHEEITSVWEKLRQLISQPFDFAEHQQPPAPPADASTLEAQAKSGGMQEEWKRNFRRSAAMSHFIATVEDLDDRLKKCLLCLSAFPENVVVKKRLLIHWWIGEGLVHSRGNGEMCIGEFIAKALIEPIHNKCSGVVDGCRLYPWIYRLLVPMRASYFPASRHVCLFDTTEERDLLGSSHEGMLTLYNIDKKYLNFEETWFDNKQNLSVVQLGRWQDSAEHHIEVTQSVQQWKLSTSLKYLSLRGISRITELPDSVGDLVNLVILDLRACHNLEKLTPAVTSLKKLLYLDVSECYLLEHMPKGLGWLSQLQVVKGFVIGNPRSEDSCLLRELKELKHLRKLSIVIGRQSLVSEDYFATLREFNSLLSLTIRWGVVSSSSNTISKKGAPLRKSSTLARLESALTGRSVAVDKISLAADKISLSFPPKLEKLDLRCFPRSKFPEEIKPSNLERLKKLYIRGGKLESLGDDSGWKVEVLRLKFLKNLVLERSKLRDAFPHLSSLEVCDCGRKDFEEGVWRGEELKQQLADSTSPGGDHHPEEGNANPSRS